MLSVPETKNPAFRHMIIGFLLVRKKMVLEGRWSLGKQTIEALIDAVLGDPKFITYSLEGNRGVLLNRDFIWSFVFEVVRSARKDHLTLFRPEYVMFGYLLCRFFVREEGYRIHPVDKMRRELGNLLADPELQQVGVTKRELIIFLRQETKDLMDEIATELLADENDVSVDSGPLSDEVLTQLK